MRRRFYLCQRHSATAAFSEGRRNEFYLVDIRGVLKILNHTSKVYSLALGLDDIHACMTVLEAAVTV